MRTTILAALLAVCSWPVPASAAPGASGETCALDTRDDPSGTLVGPNVWWGTVEMGPVSGSDPGNPANVVHLTVDCDVKVNGVVVASAYADGYGSARGVWQIAYPMQPGDVVELCTTWHLVGTVSGGGTYYWDATTAAFTQGGTYDCEPVVVGAFGPFATHTVQSTSASV